MRTLKYILLIAIILILSKGIDTNAQETKLIDSRDGKEYKILYIGNQVWMGQNLNYETENSWVYADKKKNSSQHGRLYTYDDAMNACPVGWHLPTDKEWQELINFYGGDLQAGLALRIDGTSAFNAEYSGFRSKDGEFLDLGHDVNYWTATNCDENDAWRCYIDRGFNTVVQDYFSKTGGLSVRCIRNNENTNLSANNDL
jgi:uncharacterized protein (TIGR02145 family)